LLLLQGGYFSRLPLLVSPWLLWLLVLLLLLLLPLLLSAGLLLPLMHMPWCCCG
jgi:hypothetical protein